MTRDTREITRYGDSWCEMDDPISRDWAQISSLGWSYELKNLADYEQAQTESVAEAERAIDEASRLIEAIVALVASGPTPTEWKGRVALFYMLRK